MEPEFEFIFALMALIPYSIPEKKLWPEGGILNYVCSAQILGFDILLMKNLKPMLLEVNANPSMRIEHEYEVSDRIIPWAVGLGGGPYLPKTCHPQNFTAKFRSSQIILVLSSSKESLLI